MDNTNKIKNMVVRCGKYPRHAKLTFLLSCFFILILSTNCSVGFGDDEDMMMSNQRQKEGAESKMPIIDAAKSLFSLPTTYDCWILKVKALFQQGKPYFPPPTFEGGSGGDEGMMGNNQGATEKVKEAAVKSLDKSKATVEDSARSAAKLAEEAVDKTVKKLKKTLSGTRGKEEVAAHQEGEL